MTACPVFVYLRRSRLASEPLRVWPGSWPPEAPGPSDPICGHVSARGLSVSSHTQLADSSILRPEVFVMVARVVWLGPLLTGYRNSEESSHGPRSALPCGALVMTAVSPMTLIASPPFCYGHWPGAWCGRDGERVARVSQWPVQMQKRRLIGVPGGGIPGGRNWSARRCAM